MDRRQLVSGAAVAGAASVLGVTLGSATAAASTGAWAKVAETAAACQTTGDACVAHCIAELAKGNKAMAECLASVNDMLASTGALMKLASYGSKHAKAHAKACAEVCKECAKICEVHAKHMDVCKRCMEACQACEKACVAAAA